jgi:hypothetical protein
LFGTHKINLNKFTSASIAAVAGEINGGRERNFSSRLVALRRMRVPGAAGFRLDMREAGASGRVRDANEMMAGRAFNLPARELRLARERLVAMGAVKFEFVRVHNFFRSKNFTDMMRQPPQKAHRKNKSF